MTLNLNEVPFLEEDQIKQGRKHNYVFKPRAHEEFYYIRQTCSVGTFCLVDTCCNNNNGQVITAFATSQDAEDFAFALNVLMQLRTCEGVIPWKSNIGFVLNVYSSVIKDRMEILIELNGECVNSISPVFATITSALNATALIGKDNVIKAMQILAWVED